jgi:hypothetical protein
MSKEHCSAAFLDITQAFEKIIAPRPLFQNQKNPYSCILPRTLQSYLTERLFQIKFKDEITTVTKTEAGVPQGSILEPVLYLIYTSELPIIDNTATATFNISHT